MCKSDANDYDPFLHWRTVPVVCEFVILTVHTTKMEDGRLVASLFASAFGRPILASVHRFVSQGEGTHLCLIIGLHC